MKERYEAGHTKCKPNVRTYNAVIGMIDCIVLAFINKWQMPIY